MMNLVKKIIAHLDNMDCENHEGRTDSGQAEWKDSCDWTFACFRMMRGFPQVEDLTGDGTGDSAPYPHCTPRCIHSKGQQDGRRHWTESSARVNC